MYSPMLTQPHLVLIIMLPRNSQLVTSRRLIVGQLTALRGRCYRVFPRRILPIYRTQRTELAIPGGHML